MLVQVRAPPWCWSQLREHVQAALPPLSSELPPRRQRRVAAAASSTPRRTRWRRETPRSHARRQQSLAVALRWMYPPVASATRMPARMAFVVAPRVARYAPAPPARLAAPKCVPPLKFRPPADPSGRRPPQRLPPRRSRRPQQKGALSAGSSELERDSPIRD